MLTIALRALGAIAFLIVLLWGGAEAMADSKVQAYRVDLQLKDGDSVVISPSIALLAGSQSELTLSTGENGSIYRTRISAAPMQVGDGKEEAVMVSVAVSILDGDAETAIANSQLGIRMGTPATLELEPPGDGTGLSLEVRAQRYEIAGSLASQQSCSDKDASTASNSVQGDCSSVSCGSGGGSLRCCGALWCCDGVCGACCSPP